jgi:subtilisin-like proprotein convertase family protein
MKLILSITAFFVFSLNAIFSQSFTGGSDSILDLQTINIPVNVSGLPSNINITSFGLEQVCINLTHTYLADIDVSLVSPDGTVVTLIANIGGGDDDFQNTCLRADASNTLATGAAPFSGTFKPMGQMGLVNNGQNPNGTWYLRITDNYGADQGFLQNFTLTFGNTPATYFQFTESDLPIVVINTNGQTIVDDPKILADMGIIYNGEGVRNHLTDPKNEYNGKIGIEIRGNYSASLPQKPYALELQDINGNSIDLPILGMPAENDWLLIANYNDKSFARNVLPYHLFDTMGHYAVRCRYVDVVINGEYRGIYLFSEKIKRDSNRVDIPKLDINETTGQDVTGGYILKIDYWDNSNSWMLNYHPIGFPTVDVHMVYYYPAPDVIVPEQKTYIQNFINEFETALYSPDFADTAIGYRKYISVPTFIDYFIINELARNVDGFKKSRFFYKDKDHADGRYRKLKAGPVWDFDWALKDMWSGSEDGSEFMYGNVDQDVDAPGWYIRLLEDSTFRDELRCRYDDLRRTILQETYLNSKIDSIATKLNESQAWHFEVWANLGVATGTGEVQAPSQTYAEEVQRLKDWLQRRLAWLDDNMPGTLNGCSFTGIDETNFQNLAVQAFPNPFKDQVAVKFSADFNQTIQYKLMDQTGRLIEGKSVQINSQNGNQLQIKGLEGFQTGVYLLEIEFKGEKVVCKLMK